MRVFQRLERNAKAFAEFAEWLRRPLRAWQVASATLCALQLLQYNSLKLCASAIIERKDAQEESISAFGEKC